MGKVLIIKGADFSAVSVGKIDFSVEMPQIQIDTNTKQVTLSASGALDVYYTTNGDTPTIASTKYTTPFDVGSIATVKAISSNGTLTSRAPKITSTVNVDESGAVTIELESSSTGTIRYTTDGSVPTETSNEYSSAISVSAGQTIKVAVFDGTTLTSEIATINIAE